ncbi:hypothetical protein [Acetobacter oeni]|uniref:Porin n=1 Tax=Acetobacter oeni TaxID=304077 RepID=A0A511XFT4_9PROT|nr:hypothetical protein [Acetobacter oeni]MBB3882268.1 hypothetical protein [Acetobacter oeni]NHO18021.1 hypothetical protein [Acetobacter oeni]GBR01159.1 hypothetical protein AA21952_0331 [Acetobacter oeni LMG 21952]GEN61812.1 hypothetical protein AOE01nite_00360 [Acetobacter oeni]
MSQRPTTLRRTRYSFVLALFTGSALIPLSARADDQSESLELMEKQIARIQEQQSQLTHALVGLQKQLIARKSSLQHSSSSHAALSKTTRQHISVANGTAPERLAALPGEETEGNRVVSRRSTGPDVTPTFRGVDQPTVESVVARRAEDVISRMAENNVGPHSRDTVGAQAAGAVGDRGVFHMGPIMLALGGFIDTSSVLENRHIASGTFNYWQDMPYPNEPRYHTNNFEGSARYSRISLMARGNISKTETISGFFEMDFGAGAATTDAYESNSYSFRLRQAYLAYDNSEANFHFLAGQAWSMLTPDRVGIIPRQESLPETIDAAMLAGQTWTRQWQARFVKDMMHHRLWLGLSIENPQTLYDTTGFTDNDGAVSLPNGQTATITSDGTGLTNPAPFSNEVAPDVIAKLAYDPSWGHYELEGILHFPHDRVSGVGYGHNNTVIAGGGGGSMIVPIIPHKLEVRLAGLAGVGIGRYGSALLPDATLNAQGKPVPLPSIQATAGIIAHPTSALDVYGYFGTQREGRRSFSVDGANYGYGNPNYSNAGCEIELSSLPCTANTKGVTEVTIGAWWRFLKGPFGTVEAGTQLAYSRRQIWQGVGGDPSTSMSQIFFDFRYLPFQ